MSEIQNLPTGRYIALETYKKNNQPVKTPVWFVIHNETIHVITRDKTGKVKRLKNNPNVKIARHVPLRENQQENGFQELQSL